MPNNISSGGFGAILSTLKHAKDKTGLIRSTKALMKMNSVGGFDCPGCAWPEPKDRSRFEFCENGAKTLMNATTTKKIDEDFFRKHSVEDLKNSSEYELTNSGRLVTPAIKHKNARYFEPISYDDAFAIAKKHFSKLKEKSRAVFYTSGRASNEAAFLYQLFARAFGTNNLCDCSNLCHESSGTALKKTIGVGKGTVQIEDFLQSDLILLIGHNPSSNHPRMLTTLQDARKNGARIVVINPLMEPGLKHFRHPQKIGDLAGRAKEIASDYFQIRIGGDHALFHAITHALLWNDKFKTAMDHDFIAKHTSGLDLLRESLSKYSFDDLASRAGLTPSEILRLTTLIASAKRAIYAWGMGITQTTLGVNTIEGIVNVALLRGHLGTPGAGLCPVRGHSNVQGNRTVGISEKPHPSFLEAIKRNVGFSPPTEHGLDVVNAILAMHRGEIDVFMALGGNFLSASPDTAFTKNAINNVELNINVATSLNRTHLEGKTSLIIPCLTRVEKDRRAGHEQFVTVENSMSIVHTSRGVFEPLHKDLLSEVAIVGSLAERVVGSAHVDWENLINNYDDIRTLISRCLPDFYDYNARCKDGFILPNAAASRKFLTSSKRAKFSPVHEAPSPTSLLLTTIRSHDQFNTSIYGLHDRYRNITGERRVVFMNQNDMEERNIKEGQHVDITSTFNGVKRELSNFTVRTYNIKAGCVAAYFPEANPLVPIDSVAFESNTPTSKLIPVTIVAAT